MTAAERDAAALDQLSKPQMNELEQAIQAQRDLLAQYGPFDGSKIYELGIADLIQEEGLIRREMGI